MRSPAHRTIAAGAAAVAASASLADPMLPDWTMATFDANSANLTNPYFPLQAGLLSIYEGEEDGEFVHIETLSTFETVNILGIQSRVICDTEYVDGVLVEIAKDWYAQDITGNVWYMGEFVVNYNYNEEGELIGTDNEGSWTADGVTNQPGVIMWNTPMVGEEYYQEFAPAVALDFAVITSLTDTVDIDFGSFTDVLNTSEGNLFDGPELVERKL